MSTVHLHLNEATPVTSLQHVEEKPTGIIQQVVESVWASLRALATRYTFKYPIAGEAMPVASVASATTHYSADTELSSDTDPELEDLKDIGGTDDEIESSDNSETEIDDG